MYTPNPASLQGTLHDSRFEHDACGIGFVAHVKGHSSNAILRQALTVLNNLKHRGATGCDPNTGDGAGISFQTPHRFLARVAAEADIALPPPGHYAVGMVFLPPDPAARRQCETRLEEIIGEEGQFVLGWRTVPADNSALGATARAREPVIRQVFVGWNSASSFDRALYIIRRRAERELQGADRPGGDDFYIPSLSARTIVYKGMLQAAQLTGYYPDLNEPDMETALALVHSRFSTNTFPNWQRAQPFRYLMHNGEINTILGNVNWMRAREAALSSELFGADLAKVLPVIDTGGSDSAMFDNCLELLVLAGRSLPHAIMMMIPEPWHNTHTSGVAPMSEARRAFYEYHSCLMEPWDGPAAIGFTDGERVGAVLDRNGLRPARYYITKDDLVVMASEAGVLDIPADRVLRKGRLQPGRMIMVDTVAGHVFQDDELKEQIAAEQPYGEWLERYMVQLDDLPATLCPDEHRASPPQDDQDALFRRQQAFGYTFEDLSVVLGPMARDGVEPVGSMGNDTPLAVLSERPQLLYNYFKQLFAQVTNPPIDSIWEALVTSQETNLGPEGNLLQPAPESCRRIHIQNPILTNLELRKLQQTDQAGFHAVTLPMLFPATQGAEGLGQALDWLCAAADRAIAGGAGVLILSDRGANRENAAIPALLATAGLHHHLIRQGTRTRASLVVESGEPREIHHFALLIGYGAGAVNPYLAYESLAGLIQRGVLDDLQYETAVKNYVKAAAKGIVKVMAKMGICTLDGYCGAQIFEAVGLNRQVVDRYFTWTASRIGGIGLEAIAAETIARHTSAYAERTANQVLDAGGVYQWRQDGEYHLVNPGVIHKLQHACRRGDYRLYQEYAQAINDNSRGMATLRGLLEFNYAAEPVPLDEVEPVEAIVRRFKTGAMSYGSISSEAHEALAIAMNRLGGKSNSGEGGEDPERWRLGPDGESRSSAIKQVASGRFGVTSAYLVNARELQIKMAQGAKPGEGGQLPGRKVYPWIARVRHSTPGVGLISPPPHHDIYSIEDLAQLIYDLKNANHHARISVKLVSEVGVGTIAAGVAKGHADVVLVSGHDGGTGASPQTSIKHAGLPWELAVAETHQTLVANNLRSRIVVETDGQLRTGRDVVVAALLGAEEFGFATAPLLALGCIMMRVCHLDTCPVGIATQNPELRQKFAGDPEHVMALMRFLAQDVRELMAKLGFRTFNEMIGRADRLAAREAVEHWKARGLDFSRLLQPPDVPPEVGRYCQIAQDHGLGQALDNQVLLDLCRPAITGGQQVEARLPIRNTQRTTGTILGSEITRNCGADGLPEDSIRLTFQGSAGQSFGAFIPGGLTLILEGDANDHVGKGLSGGKIVVRPPAGSTFIPQDNIIIGNVALYGATSGELYVHGMAGERFAVRNSGAAAVVEAVGDHGCEYMTGGRVVVLGPTGRNFAAGMSGGIAYVLDEAGDFAQRCNQEMVLLTALDAADAAEVQALIRRHVAHTGSGRGHAILARWDELSPRFVKVYPRDYKRMVEILDRVQSTGLTGDDAIMAAFQENLQDAARLGGR